MYNIYKAEAITENDEIKCFLYVATLMGHSCLFFISDEWLLKTTSTHNTISNCKHFMMIIYKILFHCHSTPVYLYFLLQVLFL